MANRKRQTSKHGREEVRKKRTSSGMTKGKLITLLVVCVVIAFSASYGTKIYRLKAENRALQEQHEQLEKEKSRLTKELKNINSRDYIEEQARKKLRLLNKDEIMFIFKDEKDDE